MTAISNRSVDVISKLVPGGALGLAHLSDEALLANTRRLVGKSNELLAALLAHLAEVEARGVHRTRRCSSLYTYCIYELRFSEDAAARRSSAARLVKQFPPLLDAIANGELHLTGLLLIGPHLTPDNHVAVLGRAKFRTKKELGKLVRDLNPLPQVPDRIQPLGPATVQALRNPTWEEYVTSLAPQIRELPLGERPCDWVDDADIATEFESLGDAHRTVARGAVVVETVATSSDLGTGLAPRMGAEPWTESAEQATECAERATESAEQATKSDRLPVGPIPRGLPPVTGPQHYQVQFSTVEEHAQLIERAKALLARSRPGVTLGELHLEAMKLLVASLEKRRFAITSRPQRDAPARHRHESRTRRSGATDESRAVSSPRLRGNGRQHEQHHEVGDTAPADGEANNMGAATALCQRDDQAADLAPPRKRGSKTTEHQRERKVGDTAPLGGEVTNMDAATALYQQGDETADVSLRQRGSKTSKHRRDAGDVASLGGEATTVDGECPRPRVGETRRREPEILGIEGSGGEGGDFVPPQRRGELGGSRRSRYVPASERREVYRRDEGRCTYVDMQGERCRETRYLELHHLLPFARNGGSVAGNLALRCAAHNALAAEEDFGRRLIVAHRDSRQHEAFSRQPLAILEEKD